MAPLTVSTLTTHIRLLFQQDDLLRDVTVTGEVSNWKRAASGHVYFRLKDAGASINAVMWKNAAVGHSWLPRDGDQVIAHGYVDVYPDSGAYQLYVNRLLPAGRGQLYAQFEALKARLEIAGLFAPERKRPLVAVPTRLGVVTSPDAAALRDILRVLAVRWPLVEVVVFPTLVQGAEAPAQIASALAAANAYALAVAPIDTILLARGGGSIEDLWAFNDERVAYAIAGSAIPVISGVGHETDFTIADFVADLRAPTPSVAAAAATPDRGELLAGVAAMRRQLDGILLGRVQQDRRQLVQVQARLSRVHPRRQLDLQLQRLDERTRRLWGAISRRLERQQERTTAATQRLEALNPHRILLRGYSIVQRADGVVVTTPDQAPVGAVLRVSAAGGDYAVVRAEGDR